MTYDAEEAVIAQRIAASYNATAVQPPNTHYDPTPGTAFLRWQVKGADAWQAEITESPRRRRVGMLIGELYWPFGVGTGGATAAADAFVALFEGVSTGGLRFWGLQGEAPRVDPVGRTTDEQWWQVNIFVPFHRDA